ncbi:MAG TPA: ribosome biogenesis GTP-binding protein YihA/YsxC [Polyangia bacterium]|nr:ribosome biogenesis GTP-binding protein YihA/YsxC [Polyangia bacterium]
MPPESAEAVPTVLEAAFIAEARDVRGLPPPGPPEVAIAGRSNVGKSTLLNRLAGRRGLARTSKTPGRTRGIVFFDLRLGRGAAPAVERLRLADLPGYGYAQVSRTERQSWQPLIEGYTRARPTLALFVILMDARRGIEDEERQLYDWLGTERVPAQVVFTKVDKLNAREQQALRTRCREWFGAPAPGRAAPLLVSADSGENVGRLWAAILAAARAHAAASSSVPAAKVAAEDGPE